MKTERPILFSAPMVRAILAGTKTQTRRVLKQATGPSLSVDIDDDAPGVAELSWLWGDGPGYDVHEMRTRVACPYGKPGDRLWVRETFGHSWHHAQPRYFYRATDDEQMGWHPDFDGWKPSIHMPRAASCITLEITGARVERLQDISEADALAEGIVQLKDGGYGLPAGEHYHSADPRQSYLSLWEAINGPGSVEANPWVWAVEFKRFQAPGAAHEAI